MSYALFMFIIILTVITFSIVMALEEKYDWISKLGKKVCEIEDYYNSKKES